MARGSFADSSDDSDDESIQWLIKAEVSKWNQKGINIIYRHRLIRNGYKAGSLNSAMSYGYVKDYEYVAIFDADIQPNPDFLKKTVPHFKDNPELGLVQARWSYVNKDENLLTQSSLMNGLSQRKLDGRLFVEQMNLMLL